MSGKHRGDGSDGVALGVEFTPFGEGPPVLGLYELILSPRQAGRGGIEGKRVQARYHPMSQHWFVGDKQCGCWGVILPPGEPVEYFIRGYREVQL